MQYPNSVMKITTLETLMGTYQQPAKQVEVAKRLLAADPSNLKALAVLTYSSRFSVATAQNPQQQASATADTAQYSGKGLEALKTAQKQPGTTDDDFNKLKAETEVIFNGGYGFAALQNKDYAARPAISVAGSYKAAE